MYSGWRYDLVDAARRLLDETSVTQVTFREQKPVVECERGADWRPTIRARERAEGQGTSMWNLRDVEVTIIDIDSDGDGLGDEELIIVEDTES